MSQKLFIVQNFKLNFYPWILAARPKTLSAGCVPILVATSLAFLETKTVDLAISLWAFVSALAIQVATNLFNDVIDFKKGADTPERLGPTRVTQNGMLSPRQVYLGAIFFLVVAVLAAVP
ncbi:MAG: UbiA family prenyltransferase, partial [Silvanigrellaceae bacterium]|nr:UbiA family prenyltransferase [Silvanigrellaceae bacterium]